MIVEGGVPGRESKKRGHFIILKDGILLDHEPRGNIHALEFLAQELKGIRNVDLGDLGLVTAGLALKGTLLKVGHSHDTTKVAHKDPVGIRDIKQAFLHKVLNVRQG